MCPRCWKLISRLSKRSKSCYNNTVSKLPLVSVLTPCFNSGAYLEGCLKSVQAQDYPRVEHIIQDGASTDSTADILARYSDRVQVVSEPDEGQSDALNRALQRCRGDILVVLNADDELLPHACSWAVAHLAEHPEAAAVYGDQYNIDPNGQVIEECLGPDPYDFVRSLCVEQVIPAQAAFIRRESMEAVGWYVDVTCKTCPDYEMWVRLGRRFPLVHAPGLIARYRLHPESQGCQPLWIEAMVAAKREVMERAFNAPDADPALRSLRRRAEAGVLWWSADVYRANGHIGLGARQSIHALTADPSPRQWLKLFGYFNHLPQFTPSPGWRFISAISQCLTILPKWVRDKVARPQSARTAAAPK